MIAGQQGGAVAQYREALDRVPGDSPRRCSDPSQLRRCCRGVRPGLKHAAVSCRETGQSATEDGGLLSFHQKLVS